MTVVLLGLDPGARETGIVALTCPDGPLLAHAVIARPTDSDEPQWLAELTAGLEEALSTYRPRLVAIEAVRPPNPHMGVSNPAGIIGAAMAFGALVAVAEGPPHHADLVVVPPGRHGQAPRAAYPPALWGEREGRAGTGRLRHCRSAWDVALAGARIAALTASGRPMVDVPTRGRL